MNILRSKYEQNEAVSAVKVLTDPQTAILGICPK